MCSKLTIKTLEDAICRHRYSILLKLILTQGLLFLNFFAKLPENNFFQKDIL